MRARSRPAIAWSLATVAALAACPPPGGAPAGDTPPPAVDAVRDTVGAGSIPAGLGTLRQDDLAITIQVGRLVVRAIPLDESIIRVLASDTYATLREVRESRREEIERFASRYGVSGFTPWYVQFYAIEPDVRFTPMDIVISSVGRDFRPMEIIPLSPGFGQNRLAQREVQTAIYLFDQGVDVNQPLTIAVESVRNSSWQEKIRLIERERALARGRVATPPPR